MAHVARRQPLRGSAPSVFLRVKVRHAELFWVIGSHHSAFSRWFPAGLRVTCDNITVLKRSGMKRTSRRAGPVSECPDLQYSPHTQTHAVVWCVRVLF